MSNFCRGFGKVFLSEALGGVSQVSLHEVFMFCWHNKGKVLEVVGDGFVGLVEPELVEVEDGCFFAVKPNGVAFGFTEFAASNAINDERAGIRISSSVFEAFDEMNT